MQIPLFKTCVTCGRTKFILEFHRVSKASDGHETRCKSCKRVVRKLDYEKNKERYKQQASEYIKSHPDKHLAYQRATWRNNPEKYRAISRRNVHRRKVRKGESYTLAEWFALCERYDNRCLRCGEKKRLTVDHVIPISKGGANTIDNIQPLCFECNDLKKTDCTDYRL